MNIGKPGSGADLIVDPDVVNIGKRHEQHREHRSDELVEEFDIDPGWRPDSISLGSHEHTRSPDGRYDVCALEANACVLFFEEKEFKFKRNLVDPTEPVVAADGTFMVGGYTAGATVTGSICYTSGIARGTTSSRRSCGP